MKINKRGLNLKTHGLYKTPEFKIWISMVKRCYTKSSTGYSYYGGAGIKVCDRWLGKEGFLNFLADMGKRPEGLTLERKKGTLDYSPENCIWADRHTQSLNTKVRNKLGRGVYQLKNSKKFFARIFLKGKSIYLGNFEKLEDAQNKFLEAYFTNYKKFPPEFRVKVFSPKGAI